MMKSISELLPNDTLELEKLKIKFLQYVIKSKRCWVWIGYKNKQGYGQSRIGKYHVMAHRLSYTLFKGDIPNGLVIDHLCRNTFCINPDHLEVVNQKENVRRGIGICSMNSKKTHCKRGHEFNSANTRIKKDNSRVCKTCEQDRRMKIRLQFPEREKQYQKNYNMVNNERIKIRKAEYHQKNKKKRNEARMKRYYEQKEIKENHSGLEVVYSKEHEQV